MLVCCHHQLHSRGIAKLNAAAFLADEHSAWGCRVHTQLRHICFHAYEHVLKAAVRKVRRTKGVCAQKVRASHHEVGRPTHRTGTDLDRALQTRAHSVRGSLRTSGESLRSTTPLRQIDPVTAQTLLASIMLKTVALQSQIQYLKGGGEG